MEDIETTNYIDLTNIPFTGSEIISTSISGNYVIDGPTGVETLVKLMELQLLVVVLILI